MQNRASAGAGLPQLGQLRASAFPQDMQKRAPSGFSVPQFPHDIIPMRSRYGMEAGNSVRVRTDAAGFPGI